VDTTLRRAINYCFVRRLTNDVLHSYGNKLFFLEYAL
jgi:hypothetical protein